MKNEENILECRNKYVPLTNINEQNKIDLNVNAVVDKLVNNDAVIKLVCLGRPRAIHTRLEERFKRKYKTADVEEIVEVLEILVLVETLIKRSNSCNE